LPGLPEETKEHKERSRFFACLRLFALLRRKTAIRMNSQIKGKEVLVLSTAMLSFISFWRAASVVLCDMGSSAYYAGSIAMNAFGPAAPWYVLAVMLFSGLMLGVYVESCAMFVRGGVYKVGKPYQVAGRWYVPRAVEQGISIKNEKRFWG